MSMRDKLLACALLYAMELWLLLVCRVDGRFLLAFALAELRKAEQDSGRATGAGLHLLADRPIPPYTGGREQALPAKEAACARRRASQPGRMPGSLRRA